MICTFPVVDLYDDLEDSRHDLLYQVYIPLFQCFCHNGVVGVSKGVCYNVPCALPGIAAVIQQHTHQFRNCHGGVSIIDMDGNLFVEIFQGAVYIHMMVYDIADCCGAEEVLLTQTQ